MTFQYSVECRDAALEAIEATIGPAPTLEIRTGAKPANCAAADTGSLLATIACPSDFLADSSGGSKELLGTWECTASATGTPGHFRMKQGSKCHIQGSVTLTDGGGDMTVNSTSLTSGQEFAVTSFTQTAGGG